MDGEAFAKILLALFLFSFFVVGKDPLRAGKNDPTQLNVVWRQKKRKKGAMTHYVPNIYCPLFVQMRNIRRQSPRKTAERHD